MTKKWNDYFYKLMKMLCERRIPRPSVSESSVWANQWLHISGFITNYPGTFGAFPSA